MEVRGQLQAPAALLREKQPPLPIGVVAEPIWTFLIREKSLAVAGNRLAPSLVTVQCALSS